MAVEATIRDYRLRFLDRGRFARFGFRAAHAGGASSDESIGATAPRSSALVEVRVGVDFFGYGIGSSGALCGGSRHWSKVAAC